MFGKLRNVKESGDFNVGYKSLCEEMRNYGFMFYKCAIISLYVNMLFSTTLHSVAQQCGDHGKFRWVYSVGMIER